MTNCECENSGLCLRHGIVKGRAWHKLCKTKEHYFRLWEKGTGPGQRKPDLSLVRVDVVLHGPGSILQSMVGCKRFVHVKQMNEWGADGCFANIDTIVRWLNEYADLESNHAKRLVNIAISRSYPPEKFTPDFS